MYLPLEQYIKKFSDCSVLLCLQHTFGVYHTVLNNYSKYHSDYVFLNIEHKENIRRHPAFSTDLVNNNEFHILGSKLRATSDKKFNSLLPYLHQFTNNPRLKVISIRILGCMV